MDFSNHRNYIEKSTCKQRGFFVHRNCIEKSTWKQRGFFDHWNYIEKSTWKQRGFFEHQNYIEKSTWKQRGFFDHRNYVKKSTRKWRRFFNQQNYIEKVHWNDVEIRQNLTYRRNMHVESTSIWRGVLGICFWRPKICQEYSFFVNLFADFWKNFEKTENLLFSNWIFVESLESQW